MASDLTKKKPASQMRIQPGRVPKNSTSPTTSKVPKDNEPASDERTVVIAIDLTDPEDLMAKLAVLNLSEAEEEQLLEDAYKINKKLKEELSKQEFEEMKVKRSYTISASNASLIDSQRKQSSSSTRQQKKLPTSGNKLNSTVSPYSTNHKSKPLPTSSVKKSQIKVLVVKFK